MAHWRDAKSVIKLDVTAYTLTGTASEGELTTFVVPANTFVAGDIMRITYLWGSDEAVTTNDRIAVRFGNNATPGDNTLIADYALSANESNSRFTQVAFTSTTTAVMHNDADADGFGSIGAPIGTITANMDLTAENTVHFRSNPADAGNTDTLYYYLIERLRA